MIRYSRALSLLSQIVIRNDYLRKVTYHTGRSNAPTNHDLHQTNKLPEIMSLVTYPSRNAKYDAVHISTVYYEIRILYLLLFAEVLSDRLAIATGNVIDVILSAQQLVDCDKENNGCAGGWSIKAWHYMVDVG